MQQIRDMLSYLKYFSPRILSMRNVKSVLKRVAYITENIIFHPDTLYIGFEKQVLYRLRLMDGITLFLIQDGEKKEAADYNNNCIIRFPADTSIELLYEECRKYMDMQELLFEYSHSFMDLYLSDVSLQSLTDAIAETINNPVMVIDNSYRVLCDAKNIISDDLQWEENIKKGYCSYEFISQFNQIGEVRNDQKTTVPFMAGCLMSPLRRCITRLDVERKQLGYLIAIESNNPFDEVRIQFLNIAGRIISKKLAYEALEKGNSSNVSVGNILIDVLAGNIHSKNILLDCMRYSPIRLSSKYYLILIDIENYSIIDTQMESLQNLLQKKFPLSLSVCYGNDVVMLLDSAEKVQCVKRTLEGIEPFLKQKKLKAIISDQFYELYEIHEYYRQTADAKKIMHAVKPESTICLYDEIRGYDRILSKMTLKNYRMFVEEKEEFIYRYDKEHGTEYFQTLYCYIKNSKSLQKTAEELFIHKNTVSYRINRAKEIFELDLSDAEARIGIYIGYMIFQMKDHGILTEE